MTQTAAKTSIAGSLVARHELTVATRDAMFALLDRHFIGVTRGQFESDLASKNHALLLYDRTGQLLGFSTLIVYETTFDGGPISVVCSGDTIMHPSAWSSMALPREWIKAVKRLREQFPNGPYYWLLLTSGFRTYRLLSTFWKTFWPRFESSTPPSAVRLLDSLASAAFGNQFDAIRGIVRFDRPQILRAPLAEIPHGRLRDSHVSFFILQNPGHARGDELVCLCELCDSNLTRAGSRMVYGPPERTS